MLNIFGSATLLRKATLLPLGYDGSIAYPWCPHYGGIGIQLPWRCGSATEPSFGRTRFDRRRIQSLGSQRRAPASNKHSLFRVPQNSLNTSCLRFSLVSIARAVGGTKGMRSNRRIPKGSASLGGTRRAAREA